MSHLTAVDSSVTLRDVQRAARVFEECATTGKLVRWVEQYVE